MTPLEANTHTQFESFSPRIVTTLTIDGEKINVRATCDEYISVESPRAFPPCDATMEMLIGEERAVTHIRLLDGIDPTRDEQPIRVLSEE